jgi:hypothetical protein
MRHNPVNQSDPQCFLNIDMVLGEYQFRSPRITYRPWQEIDSSPIGMYFSFSEGLAEARQIAGHPDIAGQGKLYPIPTAIPLTETITVFFHGVDLKNNYSLSTPPIWPSIGTHCQLIFITSGTKGFVRTGDEAKANDPAHK